MKCPVCSHVNPDTLTRCGRCGRVAAESESTRGTASTLIEFPAPRAQARPSLPDWRVELNEKVRAIKARRTMEALVTESTQARHVAPTPTPAEEEPEEAVHADEPANPIVAAALNRVRRASENAARVATPQISAGAAARAMASAPQPVAPEPEARVIPLPAAPVSVEPEFAGFATQQPVELGRQLFDPSELLDGLDDGLDILDDIAEPEFDATPGVTVVDPPASLLSRAVAGIVDAIVLAIVATPFLATTYVIDGDLRRPIVQILLATTIALLAAFYVFATLSLSGKTIGMMFARLRVVDASGDAAPPARLLVRLFGYVVAAAPAGIGFAWAIFHPAGCGWHDLLSGTRVVED